MDNEIQLVHVTGQSWFHHDILVFSLDLSLEHTTFT